MTLVGEGRLHQSESSRTLIYISQRLVRDSKFPFRHGDELEIRIQDDHLVIRRRP
jgi:hypothetical protein